MHLDRLTSDVGGTPAFRRFWINDVNHLSEVTKRRLIYAPNPAMKAVHRRLVYLLRPHSEVLAHGTAVVRGSSPRRNVKRHAHNRHVYLLDLASAYVHTGVNVVVDTFLEYLPGIEASETEWNTFVCGHLMSREGGLATGGNAAPDVFNLAMARLLDDRLSPLCRRWGIEYTRYLDDLTFSSLDVIGERKRAAIRTIIREAGYDISHHKAAVYDLTKGPVTINGVGLELGGRMFTPRSYHRDVAALIRRATADPTIDEALIHGRMGAVVATSPTAFWRNRTERRLDNLYAGFRAARTPEPII